MSEQTVTSTGLTAGMQLRQARETAGLHIGALSVSLKVPVKKIESLEADRLDLLPDAVFARALASSICRTLKVNPAPILAALPQGNQTVLKGDDSQMKASFQPTGGMPLNSLATLMAKPFVVIGLALVAGALLLLVLPERTTAPVASLVQGPEATSANMAQSAVSGGLGSGVPPGGSSGPQKSTAVSLPTQTDTVAIPPIAPITPIAPENPATASSAAINSRPAGVLAFEARGPSWVEVIDSAGVVQLRKTLETGERIAAEGALPLKVVVGRADAISVKVRGQDFALPTLSRDNVARFEVK